MEQVPFGRGNFPNLFFEPSGGASGEEIDLTPERETSGTNGETSPGARTRSGPDSFAPELPIETPDCYEYGPEF
jgi:hypothetical protein